MFTCDQCGKTTSSGEKAHGKVVETRQAIYPTGHRGTEIVKEIKVCDSCVSIQIPIKGFVYAPYIPMLKAVVMTKDGPVPVKWN